MKEQEYKRNAKDKSEPNSRVQLFIDKPISWLFAQAVAISGMVMIAFPLLSGVKSVEPGVIILDIVAVSVIFIASVILKKNRAIGVAFDVFGQALLVERMTFFGDVTRERYDTRSIKQIKVDAKTDSDNEKSYQLQLELDDNRCIPLTTIYVYNADALSSKTDVLREVVFGSGRSLEKLLNEKRKNETTPKLVLAIVLVVLATPVGAHHYARSGALPKITVETGVPTSDVLNLVQAKAASVFQTGEKVLWVGQPQFGREEDVKGWWTIGFAYVWTLFSLFWCCGAIGFKWQNLAHPFHALFLLFGLPFVGIGFTLLLLPYFSYKDDLTTVYVLTDRAAVQITGDRSFRLVSFDSKDFGPLKVTEYSTEKSKTNDRADVMFVSTVDEDGDRGSYDGFWGVSDYAKVISLLQAHGVDRAR